MIWEILKQMYKIFIFKKSVIAILDAPVLFETVFFKYICFPIVVVYVPEEEIIIQRIMKRNPEMSEEEIRTRIRNQMDYR